MPQSMYQDVIDFHNKMGIFSPEKPRDLDFSTMEFRVKRTQEEIREYLDAYADIDLAGQLDALVDLVYIALGTAVFQGFNFDEAWRRVHAANMQKRRAATAIESKHGSTLDVVKPEGWVAPDLSDLV